VDIDEVAQRLDVEIEREGFETVGGYLLSHSAACRRSASSSTSTA
jgi:CBS domain containing-hemolysin-like protein